MTSKLTDNSFIDRIRQIRDDMGIKTAKKRCERCQGIIFYDKQDREYCPHCKDLPDEWQRIADASKEIIQRDKETRERKTAEGKERQQKKLESWKDRQYKG